MKAESETFATLDQFRFLLNNQVSWRFHKANRTPKIHHTILYPYTCAWKCGMEILALLWYREPDVN